MSLDDSNGGRPAPPIPKAADLLTPQPLPIPNGLTYSTVPPSLQDAENDYETEAISGGRVGLNTGPRLVAMTGLGSFWGFALGAYLGGRQSGLQYLAENAHKLPTTVQGWYFYHKTKNYRVALGGIKRGARYALRTGGLCFVYGALEAGLDDVRGEADLFNSVASGVGSGAIFAALTKLSRASFRSSLALGAAFGLIAGGLSDIHRSLAGNPPKYWTQLKSISSS